MRYFNPRLAARKAISSTAYLILAATIFGCATSNNSENMFARTNGLEGQAQVSQQVPLGSILPFYGSIDQIPQGFLLCNGDVLDDTKYPRLASHLEKANPALRLSKHEINLPDLRGVFLRGLDLGRDLDPETAIRTIGHQQKSANLKHTHESHRAIPGSRIPIDPGDGVTITKQARRELYSVMSSGNDESRPVNIVVNFVIKY